MLPNASVVLLWLLTRAISFPTLLGPIRLPVEGLGAAATVVEVVLLVALAMLRRSTPRREGVSCGNYHGPQCKFTV